MPSEPSSRIKQAKQFPWREGSDASQVQAKRAREFEAQVRALQSEVPRGGASLGDAMLVDDDAKEDEAESRRRLKE
eukprot:3705292-Pyramimonas_sp.AAC.1